MTIGQYILKTLYAALFAALTYFISPIVLRQLVVDKDGNHIPPGPLIRYAFLRKYAERALHAWAEQYGALFSIWMGSQLFVVVSDPHVARELLVTNGAVFSSRKKYFMKNQVILRGRAITASEYGSKWRQHRRLAGLALNPKAMQGYATIMDYESHIRVHSTSGIIQWFPALIPSHPEVLARAHEELDRVIGHGRWPNADDEPNLPYIRAVIKEVQRVHAPFWFATPHCTSEDLTYNGMLIPKDTVVVLNCYTLHHNELRYPDSFTFNPDRYLGDGLGCGESAKLANVMERDHWTFEAGRRICPGLPAAERELWLAISRLLWAFTFHALPDEPISFEEYDGLSGRTPIPYRIRLIPRLESLLQIMQSADEIVL